MLPNPFREPILPPEETDAEVNDRLLKQLGVDTKGIRIGKEPDGKPRPKTLTKAELLAAAKAATNKAHEEIGISTNPLENPHGYLRFATQLYTEQDLPEWAPTPELLDKLKNLSPEKRALISQELREGAIAILMPGRAVQEETLAKAIQNLKPLWIEDGEKKEVNPPYVWSHTKNLITTKAQELFKDTPEHPYLLLTKPSQRPLVETTNKTLTDQRAYFATLKVDNPNLHAMNIPGYIALQSWATRIQYQNDREDVTPLDKQTYTRFIGLPVYDNHIPCGDFYADHGRLSLDGDIAKDLYSTGGFRLEMEVEL